MLSVGMARATKKISSEIRSICEGKWKEQLVAVSIPDPADITRLEGIIRSPSEAPTGNYIFTFEITLLQGYPFRAPRVLCKNKIWHPKFNLETRTISLAYIYPENWKPATGLSTMMLLIMALLDNPDDITSVVNEKAKQQILEDEQAYRKQALEWAEKDNSGYGMIQFEDLRLKAIQSCLSVPALIPYECHFFCRRSSSLEYEIVATVAPCLVIYREKVGKDFSSTMKRVTTSSEFHFNDEGLATISCGEFSRDKCWKVSVSKATFKKAEMVSFDPRKDSPPHRLFTLTWCRPEIDPVAFTEKFEINASETRSCFVHVDPTAHSASESEGSPTHPRPTLPLLLNLPLLSGRKIDITVDIGSDYFNFGALLLNDETGVRVNALEAQDHVPRNIVRKILTEWLQGKGQDVTWGVLVRTLEAIGHDEIAVDINGLYKID